MLGDETATLAHKLRLCPKHYLMEQLHCKGELQDPSQKDERVGDMNDKFQVNQQQAAYVHVESIKIVKKRQVNVQNSKNLQSLLLSAADISARPDGKRSRNVDFRSFSVRHVKWQGRATFLPKKL